MPKLADANFYIAFHLDARLGNSTLKLAAIANQSRLHQTKPVGAKTFTIDMSDLDSDPLPNPSILMSDLSLSNYAALMKEFLLACAGTGVALDSTPKGSFFKPGTAWNIFVRDLKHFFETCGGKATAARGGLKGFKPSKFVRFVFDVQLLLPEVPEGLRAHQGKQLDTTLQSAVSDAISKRGS